MLVSLGVVGAVPLVPLMVDSMGQSGPVATSTLVSHGLKGSY